MKDRTNRRPNGELPAKVRRSTYKLLMAIKKGQYTSQIARQLKTPRSTIKSRIFALKKQGFIKEDFRSNFVCYRLMPKGYNVIKRYDGELSRYIRGHGKTRLHRLNIKFPITDNYLKKTLEKTYDLNNWIQSYSKVSFPIGITLKMTTKSIVVMFHEFETDHKKPLTDFFSHVLRGCYYVYYHLMNKYQVKMDIFSGEITDQHLANERPDLEGKIDEKKITVIDLMRKSKGFFPTELKAKAWVDFSKGMPEIETNDFLYEERLIMMPETLARLEENLIPAVRDLTKQIHLHLEVQKETLKTLKAIRKSTGSKGNRGVK